MVELCYLQRVQPEYIKYSMESLYDVVHKINAFVSLVDKVSHSELLRIGNCLLDLLKLVVQSDLKSMRKMFAEHMLWFKSNILITGEQSQYFWDKLFATLPAVVSAQNAIEMKTLASQQILPVYLDIRLPIELPRNENVSDPGQFKWKECQNIYNNISGFLMRVTSIENSQLEVGAVSNLAGQYSFQVVNKLYQKHLFYDCVDEMDLAMNAFEEELDGIAVDVENILQIIPGMNDAAYWNMIKDDLNQLNITSLWLSELVASYAANKTTKIELSNIIGQNKLSDIEFLLDHISSVITTKGIVPLLEKISELDINADIWYTKALDIVQMLVPSYEDRGVKSLHIWRHPVALLETEDILKFKYGISDTWRSWEMSATLNDFIVSGNAKGLILNITKEFANTLYLELVQLKMHFRNARHEVLKSFADVINHFTDIQQEGLIGDEFIQ